MSIAITILSALAMVMAIAAMVFAHRTRCQAPKPPTREERIARLKGAIEGCRGAELALADHADELPAAMMLAQHRSMAAIARHELRAMGVEV